MWSRHRWMVPYAAIAGGAVYLGADWAGFTEVATRLALGVAAAAVAVNATTNYRVLALTSEGLMLFRASRIRQYAVELLQRLPGDAAVRSAGGTMLAADWEVAGAVYTVPRGSEQAIQRIAAR